MRAAPPPPCSEDEGGVSKNIGVDILQDEAAKTPSRRHSRQPSEACGRKAVGGGELLTFAEERAG